MFFGLHPERFNAAPARVFRVPRIVWRLAKTRGTEFVFVQKVEGLGVKSISGQEFQRVLVVSGGTTVRGRHDGRIEVTLNGRSQCYEVDVLTGVQGLAVNPYRSRGSTPHEKLIQIGWTEESGNTRRRKRDVVVGFQKSRIGAIERKFVKLVVEEGMLLLLSLMLLLLLEGKERRKTIGEDGFVGRRWRKQGKVAAEKIWTFVAHHLLAFSPFCPSVLEPYLNSCLAEVESKGKIFPREHVGVLGLFEGPLQLVELESGERRPASSDLARFEQIFRVVVVATVSPVDLTPVNVGTLNFLHSFIVRH